jgi:hypothetical protein
MPTDKWTNKEERQYEHIKSSARRRGASQRRAKAIAGATVNRDRRRKGRTPNSTTQGTGNPNTRLEDRSKQELYNLAKERDVSQRSKMTKAELISALRG